jgi:hypothetical protein
VVSGLGARILTVEIELGDNRDPNGYYYLVFNTAEQIPYVPNPLSGYFYTPDDPNFQFSAASAYVTTWTHYLVLGPDGYYKMVRGPFVAGGSYPPEYLEVSSGEANKFKIQFPLSRFEVEEMDTLNFNFITARRDHQIIDKLNFDYSLAPVAAGVSVVIAPEAGDGVDEFGQKLPALDIVGGVLRIE